MSLWRGGVTTTLNETLEDYFPVNVEDLEDHHRTRRLQQGSFTEWMALARVSSTVCWSDIELMLIGIATIGFQFSFTEGLGGLGCEADNSLWVHTDRLWTLFGGVAGVVWETSVSLNIFLVWDSKTCCCVCDLIGRELTSWRNKGCWQLNNPLIGCDLHMRFMVNLWCTTVVWVRS